MYITETHNVSILKLLQVSRLSKVNF